MSTPEFKLDFARGERLGLDEAIFCAGKSVDQIERILLEAETHSHRFLLTRFEPAQFAALSGHLKKTIDYDPVSRTGIFGEARPVAPLVRIGVLTAGTADIPAAREALRTLEYNCQAATEFNDIGVAGLWRLVERLDEIRRLPVLIVAAGMDAAVASVVGGLVPSAIIALPTSVGYGVAAGGMTALNAMLASCAPGIVVVNIDNGYGAACAALRIVRGN